MVISPVPAVSPRRILVIKLSALGDVVQALAACAVVRRHHAGDHITVLTTRPYAGLLGQSPYFDAVEIDDRPSLLRPHAWLALRRQLRAPGYDTVYDLQTSDRSGWYFRLMRRRDGGPLWSGIAPGCALPHTNPARDALHTLERQAEQLAEAGVPEAQPPALPDLSWCRTPVPAALAASPTARLALLAPGAAPHRPAKRWPAAGYAALAVALARDGLLPVVLGTSAEAKAARVILEACPEARDLTGQTSLLDLAALGRRAALAVGNDTGPMHLLAATGCPALVLFSAASDPALCAPRGPRVRVFRAETLETVAFEPIYAEALDALVS